MCSKVYVIFEKAKTLGFLRYFLHPEISHCYIVFRDGDKWMKYNTTVDYVDISELIEINGIIVSTSKLESEGHPICLNTCVSAVKRFIGLRDNFILTPYQLYKRLNHGHI
jgi:hypothetical protein